MQVLKDVKCYQKINFINLKILINLCYCLLLPVKNINIYYPSRTSLVGHNFNWIGSFLSVPLSLAFGPTVAYNLTFLLTIVGSGFGAYLLARYLTGRRDAAFVAGLVFAFFPYHLTGNWDGQMNLANIQWLPLFALFLLRTIEAQRVRDAVWAGVFAALASLDCWFLAFSWRCGARSLWAFP